MINRLTYTDEEMLELRHTLTEVFKSVYFIDKRAKHKLQDSYFLNFSSLVDYARNNNIDAYEYIRSIRNILLTYPQTYEAY